MNQHSTISSQEEKPKSKTPEFVEKNLEDLQKETENVLASSVESVSSTGKRTYKKRTVKTEEQLQEEQKNDVKIQQTGEGFALVLLQLLEFFNVRLPNPTPITNTERDGMKEATVALVKKRVTSFEKYQEELVFGGCLMAFVLPRILGGKKQEYKNDIPIKIMEDMKHE